VRRIEVGFDQDRRDDKATKNTPADFQASFGFMLKRSNELSLTDRKVQISHR
jgi:hypothetical protein